MPKYWIFLFKGFGKLALMNKLKSLRHGYASPLALIKKLSST